MNRKKRIALNRGQCASFFSISLVTALNRKPACVLKVKYVTPYFENFRFDELFKFIIPLRNQYPE